MKKKRKLNKIITCNFNTNPQNILALSPASTDDGNNHYEQYNIVGNGVIKSGDFVYVATDTGKQSIAQVQSIWDTKE